MAESLELLRRAHQAQAARALGLNVDQPRYMTAGVRAQGAENDILVLPEEACPPIQDLTPGSPTLGQFYFLIGYDAPDSGARLR